MRTLITSLLGLLLMTNVYADGFTLTSPAFKDHAIIPVLYSCDGKNLSPPLHWENPPAKTQSYVLIMSSPEWAQGVVYKWIVYNLPATLNGLAQGADTDLPADAMTGMNSFQDAIYRGPCPPDSSPREYDFTLYALDILLPLEEKADIDEVFAQMKHHILIQTDLKGMFQH